MNIIGKLIDPRFASGNEYDDNQNADKVIDILDSNFNDYDPDDYVDSNEEEEGIEIKEEKAMSNLTNEQMKSVQEMQSTITRLEQENALLKGQLESFKSAQVKAQYELFEKRDLEKKEQEIKYAAALDWLFELIIVELKDKDQVDLKFSSSHKITRYLKDANFMIDMKHMFMDVKYGLDDDALYEYKFILLKNDRDDYLMKVTKK